MPEKEPKRIASVKKALDILDVLIFEDAQGKGIRLGTLAERTGILPNTLHGILQTMVTCGYAEQDSKARYHMGKRCRQIGVVNRFRMTPDVSERLEAALDRLCAETGESVSFYVLDGGERIIYANYESRSVIKVDYSMLEENSMYDYPTGRILTAFATPQELEKILQQHGLPGERWGHLDTKEQLSEELARVRQKKLLTRYSADGVASYAVPVFWEGALLGTVGVYMPLYRKSDEKEALIREKLQAFSLMLEES